MTEPLQLQVAAQELQFFGQADPLASARFQRVAEQIAEAGDATERTRLVIGANQCADCGERIEQKMWLQLRLDR